MKQLVSVISVFFLFLVSVEAWAAEKETPLVQVYCDAFIQRAYSDAAEGPAVSSSDRLAQPSTDIDRETEDWQQLIQRLESREPIPEARLLDPARYEQCLRENRSDFEEGEFILDGKQLLEQTLKAPKASAPLLPRHAAQVNLAELGSFSLDLSNQVVTGPSSAAGDELRREAHYRELWQSFLLRVRGNFAPHRAAAQSLGQAQ